MVSTWDEHLGLVQVSDKIWRIGTYGYEWIGSIYELVPESESGARQATCRVIKRP